MLYDYDLRGNLISVDDAIAGTSWLDGIQRDPNTWQVTGLEALGGDVRKHLASYAGGALSEYRAQTTLSGTPVGWDPWIQEVALSYDVAGRVSTKTDRTVQVAGNDAVEEFGYDALDRLTSVGGAFAGYTRSYAYDALGNLDDNSCRRRATEAASMTTTRPWAARTRSRRSARTRRSPTTTTGS